MAKTKILIITDIYPAEAFQKDPEIRETLATLGDDVEIEVIQDNIMLGSGEPGAYVHRMEKEGPEWMEPQADVMTALPDKDVLLVHWAGVNSKMIDQGKNLKFIGAMRSGFEHINKAYAESKGITVMNSPGRLADSVADLTLAFLLSETRGIVRRNLGNPDHTYRNQEKYDDSSSRPLRMLKIGLIGFGIIAQQVAKRLKACNSTVMAYDPYCDDDVFQKAGVKRVELDELLRTSDAVSMHVRLSDDNRGMIGKAEFEKMKPTAIFINTARGGLVDEEALIWALQNKVIRGAGLDVFAQEPPDPENPLFRMDNVTATSHIGGVFNGMLQLSCSIIVNSLREFLENQKECVR